MASLISRILRMRGIRNRWRIWLTETNFIERVGKDSALQRRPEHHGVMANEQPGMQQHTDNRQKTDQPTPNHDHPNDG
jgi:hypothetical protein